MRLRNAFLLLLAILVSSGAAYGQDYVWGAGTREIGVSGYLAMVKGSHTIRVSGNLGYMLTSNAEVETEMRVGHDWYKHGVSTTNLAVLENLVYNLFQGEGMIIFILAGAGLGGDWVSNGTSRSDSDGLVDLGIGLKGFLSDDSALRMEYRFERVIESGEEGEDYNTNQVLLGISLFM